jgi:hypothetical protein
MRRPSHLFSNREDERHPNAEECHHEHDERENAAGIAQKPADDRRQGCVEGDEDVEETDLQKAQDA